MSTWYTNLVWLRANWLIGINKTLGNQKYEIQMISEIYNGCRITANCLLWFLF